MTRRSRRILFTTLGVSGLALFYVGCIHRVHETIEQDGWLLEWNYKLIGCRHCTGRVTRLEFEGQAIECPADEQFDNVPKTKLTIQTPSGALTCFRMENTWRVLVPHDSRTVDTCDIVTQDELKLGYYDIPDDTGLCMKVGTPSDWCVGLSENYRRWLDPKKINELPW